MRVYDRKGKKSKKVESPKATSIAIFGDDLKGFNYEQTV
jgi:hypothetical protein